MAITSFYAGRGFERHSLVKSLGENAELIVVGGKVPIERGAANNVSGLYRYIKHYEKATNKLLRRPWKYLTCSIAPSFNGFFEIGLFHAFESPTSLQ